MRWILLLVLSAGLLLAAACDEEGDAKSMPTATVEVQATDISPSSTIPQTNNCHPSYPDVCLQSNAGDYDCAGGSGNGPNYVSGPITVLPPDPFDLDRDGDGVRCE